MNEVKQPRKTLLYLYEKETITGEEFMTILNA